MARVLLWATIGAVSGFAVFLPLFLIGIPKHDHEGQTLCFVFAVMASMPVAVLAAIFGALKIVMEELSKIRLEMMRWQRFEQTETKHDKTSTQFRAD